MPVPPDLPSASAAPGPAEGPAPQRHRGAARLGAYALAVLATAGAFAAQHLLQPYFLRAPFLLFFAAVMLSGWRGGMGPGLLSAGLSALVVDYFFLPPFGSWSIAPEALLSAGVFLAVCLFITYLNAQGARARREAEARGALLARAERRLAAITTNATQGLLLMDARQHCVFMNPAAERITGFTLAEVQGRPLHDFVHHTRPDGRPYPLEECPIDRALPTRMQEQGEEVFVHRDGRFYPVAFTASPVLVDGRPEGTVIELRETSEQKRRAAERERLLAELQQAVRVRDDFLSVASHELKTPLTSLGLKLHAWARGARDGRPPTPEGLVQDVEMMRRQVRRLTDLVNDLLDVSRIGSGRFALQPEEVELAALVREMAARFEQDAARAGCALEVHADAPVLGSWDRLRLEQVLANLLSNALKYGAGKPVQVRLEAGVGEAGAGEARLSVRDAGIGIAPEAAARIFGKFERAVSERHYGGLGLGLYITRQLVDAMGGRITVESRPGEGARFEVVLPLVPPVPAPAPALSAGPAAGGGGAA
jgi:PAS domain S-box-containing protein